MKRKTVFYIYIYIYIYLLINLKINISIRNCIKQCCYKSQRLIIRNGALIEFKYSLQRRIINISIFIISEQYVINCNYKIGTILSPYNLVVQSLTYIIQSEGQLIDIRSLTLVGEKILIKIWGWGQDNSAPSPKSIFVFEVLYLDIHESGRVFFQCCSVFRI